jgi:tetratricopeptide (TPR) repeat protein
MATGDFAEAQNILAQAVPLARASGDKRTLCRTLSAMGHNHYLLDKLDESLMLARDIGDVLLELRALRRLGIVFLAKGDLDESEGLLRAVHMRAVQVGNREQSAVALNDLALASYERKDYATMRDFQQQALALAREIGAQDIVALGLSNTAYGDITLGKLAAAQEKLCEALTLALRLGTLQWAVGVLLNFAELAYAEGQTERALALCGLARKHPAWHLGNQRGMDMMLAEWALDPSVVEAGLAKGEKLDWEKTVEELLKGRR